MKKSLLTGIAVALCAAACYLAICGYRNYRSFQDSCGSSEHEIHLERAGIFTITANPPGRSFFRPGGVLGIYFTGVASETPGTLAGKGSVKITDRNNRVCFDETLENVGLGHSSRGRFIGFPREFDTSIGGPYQIQFEISEPFLSLTNIPQVLSVHHFVSGNEVVLHLAQFGGSVLLLAVGGFLAYKPRRHRSSNCSPLDP